MSEGCRTRTGEQGGDCPGWNRLFVLFVAAIYEVLSFEMGDRADQAAPVAETFLHREALTRKTRAMKDLIAHMQSHATCAERSFAA